jgi:SAM-dependent methyltransferase
VGKYEPAEWYDNPNKWMQRKAHQLKGVPLQYHPPWPPKHWWTQRFVVMIQKLGQKPPGILDLGCGNGLFAAFLHHRKVSTRYVGIDFSEGSVEEALQGNRERGGHPKAEFYVGDISDPSALAEQYYPGKKPYIVCAETLEHIKDDLEVLENLPSGYPLMITVPRFDAPTHVRCFPRPRHVRERYGPYFAETPQIEWIGAPWRRRRKWCHIVWGVSK